MGQAKRNIFQAEYGNLINGNWVQSESGKTIDMFNPATGELLAKIQQSNEKDIDKAVRAAYAAFPKWSQTPVAERQRILIEMTERLRRRTNDYALMETLNNGKPLVESTFFDIPFSLMMFEQYIGAGYTVFGKTIDHADAINIIHREPIGVCAQIIPWNVPLAMMSNKVAAAMISGNTVVLKPAETVCLSVMEFFKEMADIIPPGVVNVVTGYGPEVGPPLVKHPLVSKAAFTGSVLTGRKVIEYSATNIIPVTMELGGKSANIVFPDADMDAAVEAAVMSLVYNKGEICLAGSRLFLHEDIKDDFLKQLMKVLAAKIVIGDPTDMKTNLGAHASCTQFEKVKSYLELGPKEGATVLCGGSVAKVKGLDGGYFTQPTIFTDVKNSMRICQEEIFGPVVCALPFKTEDEVVSLANQTPYGLGGGVWTKDLRRAHTVSRRLQTGTVWINCYYNFKPNAPIGGYKQSGFGTEFCHEMLNYYTKLKSVIVNLNEGPLGIFVP